MSKKNKLKTRAKAHEHDLKREKETVKKSNASAQKSREKTDKKALKSKAKQQRRALLKKGVKYEDVQAKAEQLIVAPMEAEQRETAA